MRIAVYSGTFNPLHIGHQAIMEYLTGEQEAYDWVYLVVSPKNPLKETISAKSGRERYEAAVSAVCRHPELHVWVDEIELGMEPPHYTIRTLDALKKREPENDFTLVIGADNLAGLRKWRDYRRILTDYGVTVYPRQGFSLRELRDDLMNECGDYRISLLLDAPLVNISSTTIREGIARGLDMTEFMM